MPRTRENFSREQIGPAFIINLTIMPSDDSLSLLCDRKHIKEGSIALPLKQQEHGFLSLMR